MILLSGGSGLLGTELQRYIDVYAPSHKEFDIASQDCTDLTIGEKIDLVIHAAAYTNVINAEVDKKNCFRTNVIGTSHLVDAFNRFPFVYISTEYVYNPINFYSWTKLWGEEIVKSKAKKYLIIRTLFKPNPFPHPKAFIDQHTRGDYVDVIVPMILKEIFKWDKKSSKTVDIGTGRKTMYELAKRTRPDVLPCSIDDVKSVKLPKDYQ